MVGLLPFTSGFKTYLGDDMTHDKNAFISAFNSIAKHKHHYKVFENFVTLSAITLHKRFNLNDSLEQ